MRWISLCSALALGGCSMCSTQEPGETESIENEPSTHPIAASERRVLVNQLGYLRDDQRGRADAFARVAATTSTNEQTREIAGDISKRQLQIALTIDRTRRYIDAGDPRAAAYQRELGRLLVEQHRALRVLLAVLQELELAAEIALMEELEAEYARSIVAYETFDDTWDYSVQDAGEDFFVEVNVLEELDRVPEHEIHWAFVTYFEEDDRAYYAEECDIELPAAETLEAYAELESFGSIEVEEVEYADISFEYEPIEQLEERYELEPPEYYEAFVEDAPDFVEAEISASFEEQDDAMEAIFEAEPEELAEDNEEFFESDAEEAEVDVQVDVIDDATGEVEAADVGEVIDEPMEEGSLELEAEVVEEVVVDSL
jgi:hypothetical protein